MSSHLLVQPSSLQFPLTLNKEVVQLLFVSNRSSRRTVTFKVKTTSPRRYSVRPTRGILWPGDQEQITITLRALRKPPSDADDCRDRFKVLSLPLDHGQAMQTAGYPVRGVGDLQGDPRAEAPAEQARDQHLGGQLG